MKKNTILFYLAINELKLDLAASLNIGIQVKFFTVDQNVGKNLHSHQTRTLYVFKILQFKINNFSLFPMMPFCQYCCSKFAFGKLATFT